MGQPLLEGQVEPRAFSTMALLDEIEQLKAENERIKSQFRQMDEALRLERIRAQSLESGAKELKHVLTPLYRALQKVFGEFHEMGLSETPAGPVAAPQFDPKWTAWMDKFGRGTAPSRVLQAVLDHGPLTRSQLRQAIKGGWSTVDGATARLNNLQLIEKLGDRWNLKG